MKVSIITVPSRSQSLRRLVHTFSLCKKIDQITIHVDHEYQGPWFNTKQALIEIQKSDNPVLIAQDDIKPIPAVIDAHIDDLSNAVNDKYGLISLFSPPRKEYQEIKEQGFHGFDDNNFLWAQFYMICPKFASDVLQYDKLLNQGKVKYHDEVRFRFAAQRTGKRIITLCDSFARHDLEVKSTLGTPSKIGSVVRDTKSTATKEQSFKNLRLKKRNSSNDEKFAK